MVNRHSTQSGTTDEGIQQAISYEARAKDMACSPVTYKGQKNTHNMQSGRQLPVRGVRDEDEEMIFSM